MFPHGFRFNSGNTLGASDWRELRWPDHEIEFLARSWHESRPCGVTVSFLVEVAHATAQSCLGLGVLSHRLDEAASSREWKAVYTTTSGTASRPDCSQQLFFPHIRPNGMEQCGVVS